MPEYSGVLHFHSETGTEGGYWAFQDEQFIKPDGWSYEGLHILKDGDWLIIMSADSESVVWDGEIKLDQKPLFSETATNFWIHADQEGIPRDVWAQYFFKAHPAHLQTKE